MTAKKFDFSAFNKKHPSLSKPEPTEGKECDQWCDCMFSGNWSQFEKTVNICDNCKKMIPIQPEPEGAKEGLKPEDFGTPFALVDGKPVPLQKAYEDLLNKLSEVKGMIKERIDDYKGANKRLIGSNHLNTSIIQELTNLLNQIEK